MLLKTGPNCLTAVILFRHRQILPRYLDSLWEPGSPNYDQFTLLADANSASPLSLFPLLELWNALIEALFGNIFQLISLHTGYVIPPLGTWPEINSQMIIAVRNSLPKKSNPVWSGCDGGFIKTGWGPCLYRRDTLYCNSWSEIVVLSTIEITWVMIIFETFVTLRRG